MTSINDLPEADSVSDGDKFAVWTVANGRTRSVSASDVKTYAQAEVTTQLDNLQAEIDAIPQTMAFNQGLTGSFWSNDVPPARIHRMTDRVLVGDAVVQNGAKSPGLTKTWVGFEANGFMTYFDSRSQMEVVNTAGSLALAVASRTSDNAEPGNSAAIGVASYVTNNSANLKSAWNFYGHARALDGAQSTICLEVDIANTGTTTTACNPYLTGAAGITAGLWVRSGGETTESGIATRPASVAMGIVRTALGNATFDKGIVFQATAISGTDGVTGTGIAMEMAKGHVVQWSNSSGQACATIFANNTDNTKCPGIQFEQDSVRLTRNGTLMAVFEGSSGAGNYVRLSSNVTGSAPSLSAQGVDANIDVSLSSKGTGRTQMRQGSTVLVDANTLTVSFGAIAGSAGEILRATRLAGSVNYINVTGGASGTNPAVSAAGADANLDLTLSPKGTGLIKFGTFTSSADVPITGSVSIKDAAGNIRKLAVIA